ncbi:MAG: hypothetical protein P4L22_02175 [Candidatus Babeliales bacterium]|nr:hypothetical protein [Candidatus Babeliales bacterium]
MKKLNYVIILLLIIVPNIYTADAENNGLEGIEFNLIEDKLQITPSNYPFLTKNINALYIQKLNSFDLDKKIISLTDFLPGLEGYLRTITSNEANNLKQELKQFIDDLAKAEGEDENAILDLKNEFYNLFGIN